MDPLSKDVVPLPWTNVSSAGSVISVWGRDYTFSGSHLVASVKSGDVELLEDPVSVDIETNAGSGQITFGSATVNESLSGDGRVVVERSIEYTGVTGTATITIYYDGFVWFDLAVTLGGGVSLVGLDLNVPVTAASSTHVHYVAAPTTYTSQNNPDITYSEDLSAVPGVLKTFGLKSLIWIGNTSRGLMWCIESDECWWTKDRADCITITREATGEATLAVEMVSAALHASAPSTVNYEFGLMATPIKPLPSGWRGWTFSTQWASYTGATRGSHVIYWPNEYRHMSLDHDPSRYVDVPATQAKITADVAAGKKIIPYWTRLNLQSIDGAKTHPDWVDFVADWACDPTNLGGDVYRLSASSGWADYLASCNAAFATMFGHMDGVYWDEVQPVPNKSATSGGGYTDWTGTRRHTWEIFGTRSLAENSGIEIETRTAARPFGIAHCSGTHVAPSISHLDVWLIGEQYNILYFSARPDLKPDPLDPVEIFYFYSYCLPMSRVQAECYGRQWGAVVLWLPQLKNQPAGVQESVEATRDMLSRVLHADVLVWPLWCNATEAAKTWTWRAAFGCGDSSVEFVPYWENTKITASVTAGAGDLKVSYYYHADDDKYLVLVSNIARTNCTASVDLKNVFPASVTNAETSTPETLTATHAVSLTIDRNDFAVLEVEVSDLFIKKGEVGGNGTELTPWGTGAEFVAGTTNGDLLDVVAKVAGDGAGVLDGQWALGSRINFTLQQWAGQLQSLLDHSLSAANHGTIYKTTGWAGPLSLSGLDVVNSATGTAGTAAIYFSGINSALADISVDADAHNSKRGIYFTLSAGSIRVDGDYYSNTEFGVYTYNPTGGTINVYGIQRLNGLCGLYPAVLASAVSVNNYGRQYSNTQHGVYLVNCTGGTYSDYGQQDSNTQHGLYDYNRNGGTYLYSGKSFSNGQYGLFLNTLSGAGRRWNIDRALLHSNGRNNLRVTTCATDNVLVKASISYGPGATYACAYFGSTAIGVKHYRNVYYNPTGKAFEINDATSVGHQVVGNIFVGSFNMANGAEAGALVSHNCFWAANAGDTLAVFKGTTYTRADSAAFFAALAAENPLSVGNICADPKFVDGPAYDFHLQAASPCRYTGVAIAGVTEDYDGRPITSRPDMGAYESMKLASIIGLHTRSATRISRSRNGGRGR